MSATKLLHYQDPHKGVHANWWCMGKKGCVKTDGTICEVGKSDPIPNRIRDCLKANGFLEPVRCEATPLPNSPLHGPHIPLIPVPPLEPVPAPGLGIPGIPLPFINPSLLMPSICSGPLRGPA